MIALAVLRLQVCADMNLVPLGFCDFIFCIFPTSPLPPGSTIRTISYHGLELFGASSDTNAFLFFGLAH